MEDFIQLLNDIEKRPNIYLGEKSLSKLEFFIWGYMFAQSDGPAKKRIFLFMDEFYQFVRNRFKICSTQSLYRIITFYSTSDNNAFCIFYEYLRLYQATIAEEKGSQDEGE